MIFIWNCHYCWLLGRMCPQTVSLEGGYGEEGAESECGEGADQVHDCLFLIDLILYIPSTIFQL